MAKQDKVKCNKTDRCMISPCCHNIFHEKRVYPTKKGKEYCTQYFKCNATGWKCRCTRTGK